MIFIKGMEAWARGMFNRHREDTAAHIELMVEKYHLNAEEDCSVPHTSKIREDGQWCVRTTLKCSARQLWNPQARGPRWAFWWRENDHHFLTAQQLLLCPNSTQSFVRLQLPHAVQSSWDHRSVSPSEYDRHLLSDPCFPCQSEFKNEIYGLRWANGMYFLEI